MNNLFQVMQILQNPQQFLQNSQAMQNPVLKNAIEMYQRGDKDGINRLADNLCSERGINRQDLERQLKSRFGL